MGDLKGTRAGRWTFGDKNIIGLGHLELNQVFSDRHIFAGDAKIIYRGRSVCIELESSYRTTTETYQIP